MAIRASIGSNDPKETRMMRVAAWIGIGSPLYGHFSCKACCRSIEYYERKVLSAIPVDERTHKQSERLQKVEKNASEHRTHVNAKRAEDIEENGYVSVKHKEKACNRTSQTNCKRKQPSIAATSELSETVDGAPKKNKGSGQNRRQPSGINQMYSKAMIDKMTKGIRLWIPLYGQEKVYKNHLMKVCDTVLLKDWQKYGLRKPNLTDSGLPRYHGLSYDSAMAPLVTVAHGATKQFQVRNAHQYQFQATGEDSEVLLQQVLDQLYPEDNE